jgi:hypothetical protein
MTVNYHYYCEVNWDQPGRPRGVYTFDSPDHKYATRSYYDAVQMSDVIWRQGPRGGVKVVKDRRGTYRTYPYGYVTSSKKHMERFMWVKLTARELK